MAVIRNRKGKRDQPEEEVRGVRCEVCGRVEVWSEESELQGGRGESREARGEKEIGEMRKCEESEERVKRERELREGERRIDEKPPGLEEERAQEAPELRKTRERVFRSSEQSRREKLRPRRGKKKM